MSFDEPTRNEWIAFVIFFALLIIVFVLFWLGIVEFGWGPQTTAPSPTPEATTTWA